MSAIFSGLEGLQEKIYILFSCKLFDWKKLELSIDANNNQFNQLFMHERWWNKEKYETKYEEVDAWIV